MDAWELLEPIGILGFGVEGESTCRYLLQQGYRRIVVLDCKQPQELPSSVEYAGEDDYLARLPQMRTVFRSAGVRPDLPELIAFRARGGIVTSQVEHYLGKTARENIFGVTGTLGKGTACTLLASMFAAANIPFRLGGNIGIPVLDLLPPKTGEKIILELSSFQLSTTQMSPAYAAVLRTTVEHLDWHTTREEYWKHKSNLVRFQKPGDGLVYCADAEGSRNIAGKSPAHPIAYGRDQAIDVGPDKITWRESGLEIQLADIRIKGAFNLENVAAAGTLAQMAGAPLQAVVQGAGNFTGLEHRLEFVREWKGRAFYNDSYATRPEATQGAVEAFAAELTGKGEGLGLILGGSDKKADFSEMARLLVRAPHLRAVALIGETAAPLESELLRSGFPGHLRRLPGLEEALGYLLSEIENGVILLSPACASFGLFANYKDRGMRFKKLVMAL